MVKHGSRQYQPIYDRRLKADRIPGLNVFKQAAGFRSMEHNGIAGPGKVDRDDERLSMLDNSDMADQGFIQDAINGLTVVVPAFWEAFDPGAMGLNGWRHLFVL